MKRCRQNKLLPVEPVDNGKRFRLPLDCIVHEEVGKVSVQIEAATVASAQKSRRRLAEKKY